MKINVNDDTNIAILQQEFHEQFPFLKLEFFQSIGAHHETFCKSKVPANETFGTYGTNHHSKRLSITPSMTVAELEQKFRACYGMSSQVFRKSGKAWLETTLTDSWTLQEQNEQGKALSSYA